MRSVHAERPAAPFCAVHWLSLIHIYVPFEYYFYVELVGDPTAEKTAALLRELNHVCRTVRLLGVYTK